MKNLLLLILVLIIAFGAAAKKQTVGPRRLKKTPVAEVLYDTIRPTEGAIRCSGYDKPNRSTRETFFLTNTSPDTICGINLTFSYFDLKGRQLHSATHTVWILLPAGETRAVAVPSWDRNNAFHYELSPAPKRRASTPYRVSSRINYLLTER